MACLAVVRGREARLRPAGFGVAFARRPFFPFLLRPLSVRLAPVAARPTLFFDLAGGGAAFEIAVPFFAVFGRAFFPCFALRFGAAFFVRAVGVFLALELFDALFFAFLLRETSRT